METDRPLSEVLLILLDYYKNPGFYYLCVCSYIMKQQCVISSSEHCKITKYIEQQFGLSYNNRSIDVWLYKQGIPRVTGKNGMKYRIRWLKHTIEQLKKEGK